ncbi:MAG: GNAT family N-acetyltransferase, partial [Ruminococcus sp.]|nr:GNAT family N-acetyltransferase [Ruminococcus sp.]
DKIVYISDNLHTYLCNHLNNDLFVFVCRDVDKIVSCCFLCISEKPSNPTFINGRTGTVLNVYTKPEYRRKGIAGKLIKMLLSEAANLNVDFVELKATDSGYDLYKSLGFEDVVSKYHNMKYLIDSRNKF